MKWLISLIWIIGLGLITMAGASYFYSGEIVASQKISVSEPSAGQINLSPSMNPIRVLLKTRYKSITKSSRANFYKYEVVFNSPQQVSLLSKTNSLIVNRKSKEIPANEKEVVKRQTHSLGVMEVQKADNYSWQASIRGKQSQVINAELVVMVNVETQIPLTLWLGIALIIIGFGVGVAFSGHHKAND